MSQEHISCVQRRIPLRRDLTYSLIYYPYELLISNIKYITLFAPHLIKQYYYFHFVY